MIMRDETRKSNDNASNALHNNSGVGFKWKIIDGEFYNENIPKETPKEINKLYSFNINTQRGDKNGKKKQ